MCGTSNEHFFWTGVQKNWTGVHQVSKKKRGKLRSIYYSSSSVSIILKVFSKVSKSPKKLGVLRFQVG